MDPITASALAAMLVKVLDGASGEAGRQLWVRFTDIVQRTFGRRSQTGRAAAELEGAPDEREDAAGALAEGVVAEAERDPELRAELAEWFAEAHRVTGQGGAVVIEGDANVIGGDARIGGDVVQTHDVAGGIHINDPR